MTSASAAYSAAIRGHSVSAAVRARALKDIRPGDILLAHLGIWSRKDPWAPAVLEPLVEGLKARGFCFRTLREQPRYAAWVAQRQPQGR